MGEEEVSVRPLAMYNPVTDILVQVEKENTATMEAEDSMTAEMEEGVITTQEGVEREDIHTPKDYYLVHTEDGGQRYIQKNQRPKLVLAEEERLYLQKQDTVAASQESMGEGEVDQAGEERGASGEVRGEEENKEEKMMEKNTNKSCQEEFKGA
jgi:hypothetical protein